MDVEPFPFATVIQFQARPKCKAVGARFPADELLTALVDASQFMLDVCPDAVNASPLTRERIVCDVVNRALETPDSLTGVESLQQGAGPYQETVKPTNPHGDYYLTRLEKRALSGASSKAWNVDLIAGGLNGD